MDLINETLRPVILKSSCLIFTLNKMGTIFKVLLGVIPLLCHPGRADAQMNCLQPLPPHLVTWQISPQEVKVQWELFGVCHDSDTCYGRGDDPKNKILHQIRPLRVQPRVDITFASSAEDIVFYKTDERGFQDCNFTFEATVAVSNKPNLHIGNNYFIANSMATTWLTCRAGLRLNVSVQDRSCSDATDSKLCNNFGMCASHPDESTFRCFCCQSFYGQFCELVDGCHANSLACLNGGTCVDGPDLSRDTSSFTCKCTPGYLGRYCHLTNSDLCQRNECSNGGECKVTSTNRRGFECTCPPGFYGDLCEVNADECLSSPCMNGATCVDGANSYACTCPEGFTGSKCEKDERPCRPGVCFNGATCIEQEGGGAKCECAIGFTGTSCMTEVVTCQRSACSEHSLDCVTKTNNDFTCVCKPGFTGQTCDVNIDECLSNPCGKGTCIDGVAGYRCRCPDGSNGSICLEQATKEHLQDSTNSSSFSSTSSSSQTSPLNLVVGVVVILVLVAMLILMVFFFVRYGILTNHRKRKVYAIEISDMPQSDRFNSSCSARKTKEFFGNDEYPEFKTCLGSGLSSPLFRRGSKQTEKF